jgi:hypothetical protein
VQIWLTRTRVGGRLVSTHPCTRPSAHGRSVDADLVPRAQLDLRAFMSTSSSGGDEGSPRVEHAGRSASSLLIRHRDYDDGAGAREEYPGRVRIRARQKHEK